MLFSPLLGFVMGYLLILATYWAVLRVPRGAANLAFRRLQLVSSGLMAFSHGAITTVEVPLWVILSYGVVLVFQALR